MKRIPGAARGRLLSMVAVAIVLIELGGALFSALAVGPGMSPSSPAYQSGLGASAQASAIPAGHRIGFWIADDDIFTTGTVMGTPLPWTPAQFYANYFNTPPYPATMLWASGLVSSGAASVPSDQEALWLSQVAATADQHPNIVILLLLFVNLSGNSIETFIASHSACFSISRSSPLTNFKICGLTPSTQYTIALQDVNHLPVATIGTFTTNSTGGFSGLFAIPNEPQTNNLWNIVVTGTPLSAQLALQADQALQLTSYMNILRGHSSIYGALFEPEYFGNTLAIQTTFRNIITGAGYQNLVGQTGSSDPILAYSSYPYFGGQLQTSSQTNQIGVHYGETGVPLCNAQNPCPIWTQPTVLNIVDHSAPLPCTIIISANDVNNPAGNSYLWASPTLRGWIQSDPYYQANYVTATSSVSSTTTSTSGPPATTSTTQTSSGSATTITSTIPPVGGIDISFSSYSSPFTYGNNFQTAGNSFPIQVNRPVEINTIAFYFSDRAYDTNPVPFTITDPSNTVLATGTIPALLQFASQQYYPIQLSQVITLQPGTTYQVRFASLPPGDTYGTSGISQDILQEAASSPGTGYLGQSQWPIFELGLMNLLSQGQGLAFHNYGAYTDLFSSPGYHGNGEIAMRFQTSQAESLQSFEVFIWSSSGSSNPLVFTLRADSSGHPTPLIASPALATASVPASQAVANTFLMVNFPSTPLQANTNYWVVIADPSGIQDVQFGRLVNAYRQYVLASSNDFQTWGVPADGPTDLGFRLTTTGESIINTVSGSSPNTYFTGIAQSFVPSASTQLKGAWVSAKPSGQNMYVSIQTDNGNDQPSGNILAQGVNPITSQFTGGTQPFVYVGFTSYASANSGTKYWLVVTIGSCLTSVCSAPSSAATLQFRADYANSGYASQSGTHYELQQGTWQSPPSMGTMNFALVSPTGHEGDPIWGSQTTTVTVSQTTTSIISTTTSGTTTRTTTTSSTTTFLASSSSSSSSSLSSSTTIASTTSSRTTTTSSLIATTTTTSSAVSTTFPSTSTGTGVSSKTAVSLTPSSSTTSNPGLPPSATNQAYVISINPTVDSVYQGSSADVLIRVSPNSLSSPQVRLFARPLQTGVSASFQPDSGTAPFSALLVIQTSPSLPVGRYTIFISSVSSNGNSSAYYSFNVVPQLGPPPHDVTIVVRDIYGLAVPGASVKLNIAGWSGTANTMGSGTVVFAQVPGGPYNVTVTYMGASSVLSGDSFNNHQLNVTVVLSPPVALSSAVFVLILTAVLLRRRLRGSEMPRFSWAK
ncbi:MAG TPA: carboxypeptidase-like regulatory domain-containing protein [Nitrososphaerales archaeon]|nr:carboxypeptidase-like regulatory domain-containing protein [Nitrososphaerales archaeon]